MRKKVRFKNVVGGIVLSLAVLATVPVLGADVISWSASASSYGVNIKTLQRQKTNDASVFANYSNGPSEEMAVTVEAKDGGSWVNCTYYTSAHPIYVVYKGTSYTEVLNLVYENYRSCPVRLSFAVGRPGDHSGLWKPNGQ